MQEELLINKLNILIHYEQFEEARQLIKEAIEKNFALANENIVFQTKLYTLLNDIGCISGNEKDLLQTITFFEANEAQLQKHFTIASYYYNLANAKHGVTRIFWVNNPGVHSIETVKEKLHEPIKLYWLAYKNLKKQDSGLLHQILINLSNSLVGSSRLVEGLQFLDMVLKIEPDFPQALISRGDNLQYLSQVTNCSVTTSLYTQIYQSYNLGILTGALPPSVLKRTVRHQHEALETIQSHGFSVIDIGREIAQTEIEFNNHTPFRKFCINSFLTLNEHSIYCNCVATEKDNLQIGVKHGMFKGDVVPKLELLLNRMKSEFALARWLFYQSLQSENVFENDSKFSELLDGEIINSQSELLRTSFRTCYGILDKIALGICKLYNLDTSKIYFETFWDDPKRNAELNKIRNFHLNALYSIACDLNTKTGELKEFRNWRNKLEHNLLVLKNTESSPIDRFKIFEDTKFVVVVNPTDFEEKTLHLLQLTRAAIFSFVFCVRLQTIEEKVEGIEQFAFNIDFKN